MSKARSVIALATLALAATSLAAQEPVLGARSDLVFAQMPGMASYNTRPGFSFGPTMAFPLNRWLGVEAELLYTSFGGAMAGGGINGLGYSFASNGGLAAPGLAVDGSLKFIQAPVLARLDLGRIIGGPVRPILYAGPQVSYMLSCQSGVIAATGNSLPCGAPAPGTSQFVGFNNWGMSGVAGAGVTANLFDIITLGTDVRYQRGFTAISPLNPEIRGNAWSLAFRLGAGSKLMHGGQGYSDEPMSPEDMATLRAQRRGTGAKVQVGVAPGVKM